MDFIQEAKRYWLLGWSVIPLDKERKPLVRWETFQKRLPTLDEIEGWAKKFKDLNIAVITGKVSGIVILDIDGEKGAEYIEDKHMPLTAVSKTRRGVHYIFKCPQEDIRNFVNKDLQLDFRGNGGFFVAPPSIHPISSEPYEWLIPPEEGIAELPKWILDLARGGGKEEIRKETARIEPIKVLQGIEEGERDEQLFKYACRLRAQNMSFEEAKILVLQAAKNCKPPFSEKEALIKIESAWKYVPGTDKEKILSRITDMEAKEIFTDETMGALALLQKEDAIRFAQIKADLKGKVNLNDFNRALKQKKIEQSNLRVVRNNEEPEPLENLLPKLPYKDYALKGPPQWSLNENGIWRQTKEGAMCACPVPVIIGQRFKNIETGDEKVEIAFYRDRDWHMVKANRSIVFNRNGIIQIADKGLPVSTENAKYLVAYLTDFEAANLNSFPLKKSVSHLGWVGKNFIPGWEGDVVLDTDESGGSLVTACRPVGSYTEWRTIAMKLRSFPISRFMLAASFSAPLLDIISQRVFLIHVWGPSESGKTAATQGALSVWGNPEQLMVSFNATKVALERLASFYSDLPMGIDERQIVGDKQNFLESLVYMLSTGKGKSRGAKGGGLQNISSWRTIMLTTGEEPIRSASTRAGVANRVLEIYGAPIPDKTFASSLYSSLQEHHGHAGPDFIGNVLKVLEENPKEIVDGFNAIYKILDNYGENKTKSNIASISIVALGDFYSSRWIFHFDTEKALSEAIELGKWILDQLEDASELDDSKRAYIDFCSWYSANKMRFEGEDRWERYGFADQIRDSDNALLHMVYIFPTIFERAMSELGYNPTRTLKGWAELGLIEVIMDGKKVRHKVKKTLNGVRSFFIAVKLTL